MEFIPILIVLIVAGGFLLLLLMILFYGIDEAWIYIFKKPLYIHFYILLKKVSPEQESILRQKFEYYKKLAPKEKRYFQHRLNQFEKQYEYIPRDGFQVTTEVQTLIAATYVMLTFGMRKYLIDAFDKIIIYPDAYYSTLNEEYHKGEFNPHMKAVVFSWNDFSIGYDITIDNLNLGIHEFTHVVLHHSLRNSDASALNFKMHYEQLVKEVNYPPNRQRLIDSDYFRIYAYTNAYEFIAVIVEHYFETPHLFEMEFPQLYGKVSLMLNHNH